MHVASAAGPGMDVSPIPHEIEDMTLDNIPTGAFFGGNFYRAFNDSVNWRQAVDLAAAQSVMGVRGHLITIESVDENELAYRIINQGAKLNSLFWIGAENTDSIGTWKWVVGPKAGEGFWLGGYSGIALDGKYSNWNDGAPKNSQKMTMLPYATWGNYAAMNAQNNSMFGQTGGKWVGVAQASTLGGYVVEFERVNPSYKIISNKASVIEGESAIFKVSADLGFSNSLIEYSISGLSEDDINYFPKNGTVILDKSANGFISIPIAADNLTEGSETLKLTIGNNSLSLKILDTVAESAPVNEPPDDGRKQDSVDEIQNYDVRPSSASVDEGSVAKFIVTGPPNKKFTYSIIGLSPEDLANGRVGGSITFDDLGTSVVSIFIALDNKTEGSESLTLKVGSETSTITVNDTSKAKSFYYIEAVDGVVGEGRYATFLLTSENANPGAKISYAISGKGINARDIGNGKLSGSVSIGSDGSEIITIPIAADKFTEGDEELTLTLTGKGVSETITIEDTSTEAVVAASFDLSAVDASVDEGGDAEFLIETDPSEAGKSYKWTITGVSTADVVSKKLSGTVVIDDDGTATITIPTATDALTEGNETITLTVNGKKATVAVLDNNTVTIASVVLENDSLGSLALYKLGDGSLAIADAGMYDGDEPTDFIPLKASPSKNYALPKTMVALISYPEGGYGLLSKTGTVYTEQKFSEDGIAKGAAAKLTASQLLAKEAEIGSDLDGDGNIGDAIVAVLDEDGDANQSDSGLFQTLSGALVIASTDLTEGDAITEGLTLMASKAKAFTLKANQTVLGIAQKDSGHWEILIQSGKAISAQTFDATTGLAKGKATVLKTAQIDAREYYYGLDLTGDDDISLVGQEMVPSGWTT